MKVRFLHGPPRQPYSHSRFSQIRPESISGNFSPDLAFLVRFCTQKAPKFSAAILLFICLLFSGCASLDIRPDPWTKDQILLQGVATTLNVIDWGQTLDIAEKPNEYHEINPILGEHPSRAEVNRYMACSMTFRLLIAHMLPSKYRNYWLGASIMVSGYFVGRNYHIGLRANF